MLQKKLTTEKRNPLSMNIDEVSTIEMIKIINNEDKKIAVAVEKEINVISDAVNDMADRFKNGGRIIYTGAGTSGRLGVLDAIELDPTYNIPHTRAFGIMAGGEKAMYAAIEGAEDRKEEGENDLEEINLKKEDIVIGIAASGRTPYTIGALMYANKIGCLTISITNNKNSDLGEISDHDISIDVGPEFITGSTRMKAGTSQKMVLNMLSTGTMIKAGLVYSNLMINVVTSNEKLVNRSIGIISEITNLDFESSKILYEKSNKNIPLALVSHLADVSIDEAKTALNKNENNVKKAISSLNLN